jgi:hypothetical protein
MTVVTSARADLHDRRDVSARADLHDRRDVSTRADLHGNGYIMTMTEHCNGNMKRSIPSQLGCVMMHPRYLCHHDHRSG